jgi:hypothetical protein
MEHRVSAERLRAQGTRVLLDWRDKWKRRESREKQERHSKDFSDLNDFNDLNV